MIRAHHFSKKEPKRYHFYARTKFSDWDGLPIQDMWIYFHQIFYRLKRQHNFELRCFVLMSNHFHGIIEVDSAHRFALTHQLELSINQVFNGEKVLEESVQLILLPNIKVYFQATKYIFRNPVTAGLVKSPIDYPYSTLHQLFSQDCNEKLPFKDDIGILYNPWRVLQVST